MKIQEFIDEYEKKLMDETGSKEPYPGLTHFPKGSAFEGMHIPRRTDAIKSAKRLVKALKNWK
jgi:hypothetical protein